MKRLQCLMVISMMTITFFGQEHKRIELTFEEDDFRIVNQDSVSYITSECNLLKYSHDISMPGVPYVIINVLIPPNYTYERVYTTYKTTVWRNNVSLAPNPYYLPLGTSENIVKHPNTFEYKTGRYPIHNYEYNGLHEVDGYRYLSFKIYPFTYQIPQKDLILNKNIILDITLKCNSDLNEHTFGRSMRSVIKSIVINGEDIDSLYTSNMNLQAQLRLGRSSSDSIDYLIVTCDSLKPAFQRLAHWKCMKGIKTRVLTLEDIGMSTYSDTIKSIKNAIKNYKEQYRIKYVLLGGGNSIIQSLQAYVRYQYNSSNNGLQIRSTETPCDLYYACLDSINGYYTLDWNKWGGYVAEVSDYVNYHPSVHLTRMLADNLQEAQIQVNRIIEYESQPNSGNKADSILMAGAYLKDSTLIDNRVLSDAEYKGNNIFSNIKTYWHNCKRFKNYDTYTDDTGFIGYSLAPNHLKSLIERGYPLVHMDTHGLDYRWTYIWDYDIIDTFTVNDASLINNPYHTVIVTSACHTNAFDHRNCLSMSFMNNPNSGIIGYFGSSRQGWCDINSLSFSPSDHFNLMFYQGLFENAQNGNHFGEAVSKARIGNIFDNNMEYTDAHRWLLFSINPIGDPEMPILYDTPKQFETIEVLYNRETQKLDIFLDQEDQGSRICIMSLDDDGESYYVTGEGTGNPLFPYSIPPINCSVCISKPGYIPFVFYLYNSEIIQNEIIEGPAFCISNGIQIGKDVTDTKPHGPVSLERGNMVVYSPNGVSINNSFEAKIGCTLNIEPTSENILTLISIGNQE